MVAASEPVTSTAAARGPPRKTASRAGANNSTCSEVSAVKTVTAVVSTRARTISDSNGLTRKLSRWRRSNRISKVGRAMATPSTLEVVHSFQPCQNGPLKLLDTRPLMRIEVRAVSAVATAIRARKPRIERTRIGSRISRSTAAVAMVCRASSTVTVKTKRGESPTASSMAT
jgi:hypothetical protein